MDIRMVHQKVTSAAIEHASVGFVQARPNHKNELTLQQYKQVQTNFCSTLL